MILDKAVPPLARELALSSRDSLEPVGRLQ